MTGENRCFRGCCVGTSDVRLDHVVRQASASVDARARWRPADESAVILRGDVLRAGPLSTVYYGRFGKSAIAIKRPKLRTTREIDRYHAELGLMLSSRTNTCSRRACAHAARRITNYSFHSWRMERWMS